MFKIMLAVLHIYDFKEIYSTNNIDTQMEIINNVLLLYLNKYAPKKKKISTGS